MSATKGSPLPRTEMDALLLGRLDELTVNEPGSRGRSLLGIVVSILVLLLISSMIVAAIVIMNPEIANFGTRRRQARAAISLEEALGDLSARDFNAKWTVAQPAQVQDELVFEDAKNLYLVTLQPPSRFPAPLPPRDGERPESLDYSQVAKSFKPNISTLVSNASLLSSIDYKGFKLSPSKRFLLLWTSERPRFRHSSTAKYFLYDIQSDLISLLSTSDRDYDENDNNGTSGQMGRLNRYESLDASSLYLTHSGGGSSVFGSANKRRPEANLGDSEHFDRFQVVDWFSSSKEAAIGSAATSFPSSNQPTAQVETNSDSLILIQNNDIYLLSNLANLTNVSFEAGAGRGFGRPLRLTRTGRVGEIFNGIPDWLYEEEILGDSGAFRVSPGGRFLAYLAFNDSQVTSVPFTLYGGRAGPKVRQIRFPKAGQPNPRLTVHLIDLPEAVLKSSLSLSTKAAKSINDHDNETLTPATSIGEQIDLKLPNELSSKQHYINRLVWLTSTKLALLWSNRSQNESCVVVCAPASTEANDATTNLDYKDWRCRPTVRWSSPGGWLEIRDDLAPYDKSHFLLLMPKSEGARAGGNFKHIAKVAIESDWSLDGPAEDGNQDKLVFLTGGAREVVAINGVDKSRALVYYTSTIAGQPGQRQLHVVSASFRGSGTRLNGDRCLTCDHYPRACTHNSVQMSPSTRHYVFRCNGPEVPRIELRQVIAPNDGGENDGELYEGDHYERVAGNWEELALNEAGHEQPLAETRHLWTIEDNRELRDKLRLTKAMPVTVRLRVPIRGSRHLASVILLLPPPLSPRMAFQATPSALQKSAMAANKAHRLVSRDLHLSRGGSTKASAEALQRSPSPPSIAAAGGDISDTGSPTLTPASARGTDEDFEGDLLNGETAGDANTLADYVELLAASNAGGAGHNQQLFPMLVEVYGGPGSQRVDEQFNIHLGHYFASNRRTIYAMIDGRGSGFEGSLRAFEQYRKFGTIEIEDQIEVTARLIHGPLSQLVDQTKVAIWGWSYGGYAAAMALGRTVVASTLSDSEWQTATSFAAEVPPGLGQRKPLAPPISRQRSAGTVVVPAQDDNLIYRRIANTTGKGKERRRWSFGQSGPLPPSMRGIFECAASVAPVTDWRLYDTAYTERYMASPWKSGHYDLHTFGDHLYVEKSFPSNGTIGESEPLDKRTDSNNNFNENLTTTNSEAKKLANHIYNKPMVSTPFVPSQPDNGKPDKQINIAEHYKRASLIRRAQEIDHKRFLLVHGTADDNVHFQHSMLLMKELVRRNILFETRIYPDQDHGIRYRADEIHLGATLSNFFAECFDMAY